MRREENKQRHLKIQQRGILGERSAEEFLVRSKQMKLLHRNWRSGREEIDLILLDQEVLVFVEVRARQKEALVSGFFSLTATKRQALLRAAKQFLRQHTRKFPHFRVDVVEINLNGDIVEEILHFENIPIFGKYQGY